MFVTRKIFSFLSDSFCDKQVQNIWMVMEVREKKKKKKKKEAYSLFSLSFKSTYPILIPYIIDQVISFYHYTSTNLFSGK